MRQAVLCGVFSRCVSWLAVVLPIVLYSVHASGQTPATCPTAVRTPVASAAPAQTVSVASENQIWKTITVGGSKGVNAVRVAMETAPCPIFIGDDADEILGRPSFPFLKQQVELDLVILSVFELGFGDQDARKEVELGAHVEVSLRDIYPRAVSLGFELCPAEVGPVLRLQYLDQPIGEFLHIAMKPVARYTGELVNLTVGRGGIDLLFVGGNGDPDVMHPGVIQFVFVRPRPYTIASGIPLRLSGGDLAKR